MFRTESASRGPQLTGWTNWNAPLCHAMLRRSERVNDAGALAPVVFSDRPEIQPAKIAKIKSKGIHYPPKPDPTNPLVMSVCPKNACIKLLDSNSSKCPKHGVPI